jgi:hypothetical protein
LAALLGIAVGLSAMASGFACYLRSTPCENLMRIVLYLAVFGGALIFAASTVTWLVSCGKFARVTVHPGGGVVNLTALLLGAWMGYGFVTEHALGFSVAVLLVMSLLAAALGAHLMVSRGAEMAVTALPQVSVSAHRCAAASCDAMLCSLCRKASNGPTSKCLPCSMTISHSHGHCLMG